MAVHVEIEFIRRQLEPGRLGVPARQIVLRLQTELFIRDAQHLRIMAIVSMSGTIVSVILFLVVHPPHRPVYARVRQHPPESNRPRLSMRLHRAQMIRQTHRILVISRLHLEQRHAHLRRSREMTHRNLAVFTQRGRLGTRGTVDW